MENKSQLTGVVELLVGVLVGRTCPNLQFHTVASGTASNIEALGTVDLRNLDKT